jgi:hypothetical protein
MSAPAWLDALGTSAINYVRDLSGLAPLMLLVAQCIGALVGLNLAWAVMRACVIEPSRDAVRLIALRLADVLRARQPAALALVGLRPLLPWPHSSRLGSAAVSLGSAGPASLVETLLANRLLPSLLAPLALAAERLGPAVLEAWLRALARAPRTRRSLFRRLAPPLVTLSVLATIYVFFGTFIAPKWLAIARELGVRLPRMEAIEAIAGYWRVIAIIAGLAVAVAIAVWARYRWMLEHRLLRGEIIIHAAQNGLPEADIAGALALPPGETFPALCRAAGWKVDDADALAAALAAARERRDRTALVAGAALEVVAPMVLALPVLMMAKAVFAGLVTLVVDLQEMM